MLHTGLVNVFPCEDIILTQLLYTCVLKLCVGEHVYKMLNNGRY